MTHIGTQLGLVIGRLQTEEALGYSERRKSKILAMAPSQILGRPLELRAIRSNRREFPVEFTVTSIDTGEDQLFTAFVRDITERKRAESELRQSEERYTLAVEAGKVGVWDLDMTSGKMYIAPHLKQLLGYGSAEIENSIAGWLAHSPPEDVAEVEDALQAC